MNNLERLGLVDRIGRELQSRMTYSDINTYLAGFKVDTARQTSGVNSKWVYVKDLLADVPTDVVLRIADELEIPHEYTVTPRRDVIESSFWEPNHFRLFLSHLSSFKGTAGGLQASLSRFGISAFVAHVDIEPTKEWQDEIEAALYSMHALAAILMPGFKESNWTDQEVGVAVGRGVLIVPIIRGLEPYGFIAKYQGLQSSEMTVAEVANSLFDIVVKSDKTRARILSCLVATILGSPNDGLAIERINALSGVADLPRTYVEQLRDGSAQSSLVSNSSRLKASINNLLQANGLSPLEMLAAAQTVSGDDDLPF